MTGKRMVRSPDVIANDDAVAHHSSGFHQKFAIRRLCLSEFKLARTDDEVRREMA
jgi:hypothetical protein